MKNKQKILLLSGIALLGIGTNTIIQNNLKNKKKPFYAKEKCINYKMPNNLIQPEETKSSINRTPITFFSHLKKIKFDKKNICEIYTISQKDEIFKIKDNTLNEESILKEIKNRINDIEKFEVNYRKKIDEIEKNSSVELTEFEKELITEIYLINKFNLKVLGKATYSYTASKTPEKLNFYFKETEVKRGIEYIDFYFKKDNKKTEVDISQIYFYNIPYTPINPNYQPKFKEYGMYIFEKEMENNNKNAFQNNETQKTEQEKNNTQENQQNIQGNTNETVSTKQTIPRQRIVDSVEIQERNLPTATNRVEIEYRDINEVQNDINNANNNSSTKKEELSLPKPPMPYKPKKIKKPSNKKENITNEDSNEKEKIIIDIKKIE